MKSLKNQEVEKDTELKEWLVNYVGNKLDPENEEVTVEMIVEAVAKEFPEFLLLVAEENFIRGYDQALSDINTYAQKENENSEIHQKNT